MKHSNSKQLVDGSSLKNVRTEVSYLNGIEVPYGTKGSVRLDAVLYSKNKIVGVWDLKTGNAGLSQRRINQILSHLPNSAPINILRP